MVSVFILDRTRDGHQLHRRAAEHKFPIRGSSTCSIVFEGSQGELLGQAAAGGADPQFMNDRESRSAAGLGIGEAAYEKAGLRGARVQMGDRSASTDDRRVLLDMEVTIAGLRAPDPRPRRSRTW